MKILLATRNEHKLTEFRQLLSAYTVEGLPEDLVLPPEEGETFAENALTKARAVANATGLVTIADDSGIAAAALQGGPGVYSARYAGPNASDEANLAKFQREVPPNSAIAYVCVVAYIDPKRNVERLFEGRCEGTMAASPQGEGGFGYDPVFIPIEDRSGRTMAELKPSEKDAISHRGRAARALVAWLEE